MEKPGSVNFDIFIRTRKFSTTIIKYCHFIRIGNVEYFLRDQLGRSGTSIGANIHEAKSSSSKREFCRFYEIALGSCHETKYWLDVIGDCYFFNEGDKIKLELLELIKIVSSIIIKVKKQIKQELRDKVK